MPTARLRPTSRLRNASAFKQVFAQGRRQADADFVVIWAPSPAARPRLGLAISKRRARRAVDRNRIKRVVRESFRHAAAELPDVDVVVLARQATHRRTRRQLFESLTQHWEKLRRQPSQATAQRIEPDHG
ncbi:ribonuclease P protein component [Salinisphaera sp. P385]|uniref:Ribonuclease P protein component n=1 Tax=Spectribacter acetivorans TaxID=3075603 RepID=A0ABU3B9M7_9GAMM|nr:ribonuclease P protein component [Salinisphaera sp. P385]MDT0618873.1 ribonuclease P protein component [Salinisphaera sp. P385]